MVFVTPRGAIPMYHISHRTRTLRRFPFNQAKCSSVNYRPQLSSSAAAASPVKSIVSAAAPTRSLCPFQREMVSTPQKFLLNVSMHQVTPTSHSGRTGYPRALLSSLMMDPCWKTHPSLLFRPSRPATTEAPAKVRPPPTKNTCN